MVGTEVTKHTQIRKENLDPNQYTLSLMKEGFRVGLIDRQAIFSIQEQIMLVLKQLIIRYTKGESTSVKTETAEGLLNSIYYCIDACISSFEDSEAGIALLKTSGMGAIYDKGVEIVASVFEAAKLHCQELVRNKLDVPMEVYNTSVTEALPEFFENYSVVFGAHDTTCSLDYPLVFDDMNVKGVFYIRNYIENLDTETQFCRLFSKEDILKALMLYGRKNMVEYKEYPINIFEVLLNSSIFSVLSGNKANKPGISKVQGEILQGRLGSLAYDKLDSIISVAIEKLITELCIGQPKLVDYIRKYKRGFVLRVANAVENKNLHNMILSTAEEKSNGRDAFLEADRLSDDSFRQIVQRVMDCSTAEDKVNVIMSKVHSLEDFIDILNADCLFDDEFGALFRALSDMELAVLLTVIFSDELRKSKLDLSLISIDKSDIAAEWQWECVQFVQRQSEERKKALEECVVSLTSIY